MEGFVIRWILVPWWLCEYERFSPRRKDKTFKLPNKLFFFFQVFISKKSERFKKKKSSTGKKVRLKGYTVIYLFSVD